MPAPLSNDLRARIISAYNSGKPVKEIALQFYVGQDAVYKLIRHVSKTGSITPKPLNNGRKPKLTPVQLEAIKQMILAQPDITYAKLIEELELPISTATLSKIVVYKFNFRRRGTPTA